MKLFSIRGGVHPHDHKHLSAEQPIVAIPLPPLLHIPLQQHIGAMAKPVVRRGDLVRKGQLIARAQGAISAPVHAPTSGRIVGIGSYSAHHPSDLKVGAITLQPDGEERWVEPQEAPPDPFTLSAEQITRRVAEAGIVGMGGATFPSAIKLNLGKRFSLHTLVINGAECEPYLTCDDRLMREYSAEVVDGVRIMAHALGVERVILAIENNKPQAQQAMRAAVAAFAEMTVVGLPTRYPMGSERHLVQVVTGEETPARCLTAEIGVVVHNTATALAVHQAMRHQQPLLSRVVTLSGGAMRRPGNYRVAIGTPVTWLLEQGGGFDEARVARIISGGPMMGQVLGDLRAPVVKGCNAILALTREEVGEQAEHPCIRCARCVEACPCGLLPLEMARRARAGDLDGARTFGLGDCISCGSCAYVCPARIPLVQYFNFAKGELANRDRAKQKQLETKRLAEQRAARIERQQAEKKAMMERRKQEMAAKKAAEAAAKAAAERSEESSEESTA